MKQKNAPQILDLKLTFGVHFKVTLFCILYYIQSNLLERSFFFPPLLLIMIRQLCCAAIL